MIGRFTRVFLKHSIHGVAHLETLSLLQNPIQKNRPAIFASDAVYPVSLAYQSGGVVSILLCHIAGIKIHRYTGKSGRDIWQSKPPV